jgi:hypothetical protein
VPVNYTLREKGGFVHIRATGRFTSAEIQNCLARLATDPNLKTDHVALFDTTGAESEAIDDEEFGEALRLEGQNKGGLVAKKWAILVKDRRFVRHALEYQRASAAMGRPTEVFASLVEATHWLSH